MPAASCGSSGQRRRKSAFAQLLKGRETVLREVGVDHYDVAAVGHRSCCYPDVAIRHGGPPSADLHPIARGELLPSLDRRNLLARPAREDAEASGGDREGRVQTWSGRREDLAHAPRLAFCLHSLDVVGPGLRLGDEREGGHRVVIREVDLDVGWRREREAQPEPWCQLIDRHEERPAGQGRQVRHRQSQCGPFVRKGPADAIRATRAAVEKTAVAVELAVDVRDHLLVLLPELFEMCGHGLRLLMQASPCHRRTRGAAGSGWPAG